VPRDFGIFGLILLVVVRRMIRRMGAAGTESARHGSVD
jgi:hypothetical protein